MTLIDVTVRNGFVTAAAGAKGRAGANGDDGDLGSAGAGGSNGANGPDPGNGTPGGNGTSGTSGTGGDAGRAGQPGGIAQGGAIDIGKPEEAPDCLAPASTCRATVPTVVRPPRAERRRASALAGTPAMEAEPQAGPSTTQATSQFSSSFSSNEVVAGNGAAGSAARSPFLPPSQGIGGAGGSGGLSTNVGVAGADGGNPLASWHTAVGRPTVSSDMASRPVCPLRGRRAFSAGSR